MYNRYMHLRILIVENNYIFFIYRWTLNLFKKGRNRDLEVNDLYTTLDDHTSSSLGNELEK